MTVQKRGRASVCNWLFRSFREVNRSFTRIQPEPSAPDADGSRKSARAREEDLSFISPARWYTAIALISVRNDPRPPRSPIGTVTRVLDEKIKSYNDAISATVWISETQTQ